MFIIYIYYYTYYIYFYKIITRFLQDTNTVF